MKNLIKEQCEINQEIKEYPTANLTLSILGTQSSGKSTLLNAVFNSAFPVLDSSLQRMRCTRGVWLQQINSINLVDTEGFDSVDRSQEDKIFEKQMGLFCVVISDVLLINLFMHEVGRYSGGHLDILEAIFKVGQRLVTPHQKKIIYVIRDCTEDADHNILSEELSKEIKMLANKFKNKQLKYSIEFFFMSHYIYQPEVFAKQAQKLLPMIAIKRPSAINNYKETDRVKYLHQLWKQIRDSKNDIDLKSIDDALKNYVMERLKTQVLVKLEGQLTQLTTLEQVRSFQRFTNILIFSIKNYLSLNKPKHMKQNELEVYCAKFFQQFEPTAIKHFNSVVIPNIQRELQDRLTKQIQKNTKSRKLSHLIFKQKKEVTQLFKKVVNNHKESSLLIKYFNEKMSHIINNEQRNLNHLFSLFQSNAENELNKIIDAQVANLVFKSEEVNKKMKDLCKQYQYNEWQVDFKDIWGKVSYRCIEKLIPQAIEDKSIKSVANVGLLAGDQTTCIIAVHTSIEKKALNFCRDILSFMNEQNTFTQPLSQVKQIVRECLHQRLIEEQRRWKISWLLISFLLLMLTGELETLLMWISIKKKKRRTYMRVYYWSCIALLVFSLWREYAKRRAAN